MLSKSFLLSSKERYFGKVFGFFGASSSAAGLNAISFALLSKYLKNDFKETDVFYAWQGEDYVILSRNGIVQKKEFWNFWDFLKKEKK